MINFNKERRTAVVYTCGICNLNCRYCTIDKNPVLKDIDKELEESFNGDYYFDRIKAYFPRPDQLQRLETWGGEPFLRMERAYPLVHKLIQYYPYFSEMFSSTNFSYDDWINQFMGLMNVFGSYPYRKFTFYLQLSVDGPEYINDANRGIGVTQRCIANFDKLMALIKDGQFPKNVILNIALKGTWDIDCFYKLNDKQKLIEFFQFYETNYLDKIADLNDPDQFPVCTSIPNTAVPAPTTKHDGEIFAELITKCKEIERENNSAHYFKYYNSITPFSGGGFCDCGTYNNNCFSCGTGSTIIGFLPHNMVSACHEGFTLLVDEYKEFAAKRSDQNLSVSLNHFFELHPTPMCLTDDQYIEHERKMKYINLQAPTQTASSVAMILALAMAGLIDSKYLDETTALYAAKMVLSKTSFCIKANYAVTGSFMMEPTDLYILLLNGALDLIVEDEQQGGCCCGNFN